MRTRWFLWYQSTFLEIKYPVAAPCERQIVRHEYRGEPMRAVQLLQQLENHLAGPEVQVAGRLVGQQNAGFSNKRTGQHDALLFPARQFTRAVRCPRLQPHLMQPRERFGGSLGMRPSPNQ